MGSPLGGFVKQNQKDGRWYEIGDYLARKKVAHTFRDFMKGALKRSSSCSSDEKSQDLKLIQSNIFSGCQIRTTSPEDCPSFWSSCSDSCSTMSSSSNTSSTDDTSTTSTNTTI